MTPAYLLEIPWSRGRRLRVSIRGGAAPAVVLALSGEDGAARVQLSVPAAAVESLAVALSAAAEEVARRVAVGEPSGDA